MSNFQTFERCVSAISSAFFFERLQSGDGRRLCALGFNGNCFTVHSAVLHVSVFGGGKSLEVQIGKYSSLCQDLANICGTCKENNILEFLTLLDASTAMVSENCRS
jgi:hypothetical protein